METAIPTFLEGGSFGVLALAFVVQMVLHIRADKRAAQYAAALREVSFDREQLITTLQANTAAMTKLSEQIQQLARSAERTSHERV